MNNSVSRIITLTKRNIKEILRDPLSLIFTIALPLFMEILFYFIFHELTAQFEMKYLAPGIVVFSESFLTLFTGLLISLDRKSSFLTRLYVSKAKSYEFIFSYALSILPIALIQSILFFLVGGIFDTSMFSVGMVLGILLSILTSMFFIGTGILFGSICSEKSIGGISSIIITIVVAVTLSAVLTINDDINELTTDNVSKSESQKNWWNPRWESWKWKRL